MGKQQITYADLRATASKINGYVAEYEQEYTKLYATVDEMESAFSGNVYNEFKKQISGLKDDFQRMKSLMSEYADQLEKTATDWENVEDEARGKVGGLTQGN